MRLILCTDETIDEPAADLIKYVAQQPDGFAILELAEQCFVQCSVAADSGVIEYRLGSADAHFTSETSDVPLEVITRTMQRFAARDPQWQEDVTWQKMND